MNRLQRNLGISVTALFAAVASACTSGSPATSVPTNTATMQPTATYTAVPTKEPTPTPSPSPTTLPTATAVSTPTPPPTPTATPRPTITPSPTPTATPTPLPDYVQQYAINQGLSNTSIESLVNHFDHGTSLEAVQESALGSLIRLAATNDQFETAIVNNSLAKQGVVNTTIVGDIETIIANYNPTQAKDIITMPETFTVLQENGVSDNDWFILDALEDNFYDMKNIFDQTRWAEEHWPKSFEQKVVPNSPITYSWDFDGTQEEFNRLSRQSLVELSRHFKTEPGKMLYVDDEGNSTTAQVFEDILDQFGIFPYDEEDNRFVSVYGYGIDYTMDGPSLITDTAKRAFEFKPSVFNKGQWHRNKLFQDAYFAIMDSSNLLVRPFTVNTPEDIEILYERSDVDGFARFDDYVGYGLHNLSMLECLPKQDGDCETLVTQAWMMMDHPDVLYSKNASPEKQAAEKILDFANRIYIVPGWVQSGFAHFEGDPSFEMPQKYGEDWPQLTTLLPAAVILNEEGDWTGGWTGSSIASTWYATTLRSIGIPASALLTPENSRRAFMVKLPEGTFYGNGNDLTDGGPAQTLPPCAILRPLAQVEPLHVFYPNSCN